MNSGARDAAQTCTSSSASMFFTDALREFRHLLHLLLCVFCRSLPAHLALTLLFTLGRARLSYCASLSAAPVLLLRTGSVLLLMATVSWQHCTMGDDLFCSPAMFWWSPRPCRSGFVHSATWLSGSTARSEQCCHISTRGVLLSSLQTRRR